MWVVVALGILVALTALVLSIPVDLGLRVEVYGRPVAGFTVEWLFGRFRKEFRSDKGWKKPAGAVAGKTEEEQKKPKQKPRPPGRKTAGLVLRIIRIPGLLLSIERLVRRVARCFRVRTLLVDFRAGLDDPCDTALIVGTLSTAALWVDACCPHRMRLVPAFEEGWLLEGEGEIDVRVFPICLLPPALLFLFSLSTIRVIVTLVRWKFGRT